MAMIERTGGKGAQIEVRRFVNVKKAASLPGYVDRVPLLFDGRKVVTDDALFGLFSQPRRVESNSAIKTHREAGVSPSSGLENAFSTAFSNVDDDAGDANALGCGNMWLVNGDYDAIDTPESEPMPTKDSQN